MANQIALRLLGARGTAVVVGRRQHVVLYEQGAAAVNSAVQWHLVDDDDGTLASSAVAGAVAATAHHGPEVSAVFVEDTHMPAGGAPWPEGRLAAVVDAAAGRPVHLDGARLFNAEVATGVSVADRAAPATTVMCCLSKGLAAPVGSLLAGTDAAMAAAVDERKRLGGAMRQAGVIAAAGLVALEEMVERLEEDHVRARRLAEVVAERWPEAGLDASTVSTNVVLFTHPDPVALIAGLADAGVLAGTIAPGVVRLMTHVDVDDCALDHAIAVLRSTF